MTDSIVTEQLTKYYGRRVGIDGLSLRVPSGSVFGFLGPNGSGKTTTIRLLLGLLRPDSGRAAIDHQDCWKRHHVIKRDLGYVPGDLRLPSWMTGASAITILSQARRADLGDEGWRLSEYYDLDMTVRVRSMSRGMRQKLGLIIALVHKPKVLILDEPTAALDPIHQLKLYRHLRDMAASGSTVFFSSHILSEVSELCERVAILRQGRMVADETLAELRRRARRRVVVKFKSTPQSDSPPALSWTSRNERLWEGKLIGAASEALNWLSAQAVEDIFIGRPDLDELFYQYYEDNG